MTSYKNHSGSKIIKVKDVIIIVLVIVSFSFIDLSAVLFIGAIVISIVLMRRTMQHLSPHRINGYRILQVRKELSVPKRIAVFEISNSANMEILYKYAEVLQIMAMHPRVLIIRFNRIARINPYEADILQAVIRRLSADKIIILFSDICKNLEQDLKKFNLMQNDNEDKIFCRIDDAIDWAEKTLNSQGPGGGQ